MVADQTIKVVLLGSSSSGKTTLIRRFTDGKFRNYSSTSYTDFVEYFHDGKRLQIWDTPGNDGLFYLGTSFFRTVDAVVLTYDRTSWKSFEMLYLYLTRVPRDHSVSIFLAGCKSDKQCVVHRKAVSTWQRKNSKRLNTEIAYLEVSSLTGIGIDELFSLIARNSYMKCTQGLSCMFI
jgi:small GTP-binding protein